MKRFASQLTFCSPERILRNTVVEQDENGVITAIFNLHELRVESTHTKFLDGIISPQFVSLKLNKFDGNSKIDLTQYQYIDLSESTDFKDLVATNLPLIFDFGNNSQLEINQKLKLLSTSLISFSIFDIIAACVFHPAKILGVCTDLEISNQLQLVIWEQVDLVNKKLTSTSHIAFL